MAPNLNPLLYHQLPLTRNKIAKWIREPKSNLTILRKNQNIQLPIKCQFKWMNNGNQIIRTKTKEPRLFIIINPKMKLKFHKLWSPTAILRPKWVWTNQWVGTKLINCKLLTWWSKNPRQVFLTILA